MYALEGRAEQGSGDVEWLQMEGQRTASFSKFLIESVVEWAWNSLI